jgi:hypothetical protein
MDCHRTWEALALGCIPIVRSSGMNALFDELPVLIVNKWSEVTRELLDNTIEKFKERTFNYDKLKLQYWVDKINSYKKENFIVGTRNKQSFLYEWLFYFITIPSLILIAFIFIKKSTYLSFTNIKKYLY